MSKKYRMPAEWEPHVACLLLYPHNPGTFVLDATRREFHGLIKGIVQEGKEHALVFCNRAQDATLLREAMQELSIDTVVVPENASLLTTEMRRQHDKKEYCVYIFAPLKSHDTWARDTLPTLVVDRQTHRLVGLDWDFNAYGGPNDGCYWPCDLDQLLAFKCCRALAVESRQIPLILEGGSIHVDGQGTLLTTKECLLHPNRNPRLAQTDIEKLVCEATGCSKIIWLPCGLAHDDDTNGHVDNFACFVKPQHIVLAWTDDNEHDKDNYERCREALQVLQAATDAQERQLFVQKLQLPPPMYYTQDDVDALTSGEVAGTYMAPREVGERMAASYVNFYVACEAILVPQFGSPDSDANAVRVIQEIFPDRTILGVSSRSILVGGGNLHCVTQQLPRIPTVGDE